MDPLPTEDEIAKILYENNYNANRPWDRALVPYKDYAIRDARAVLAFLKGFNRQVLDRQKFEEIFSVWLDANQESLEAGGAGNVDALYETVTR